MKTVFRVTKKDEWALTPVQNQGQIYSFAIYNAYTTLLRKYQSTKVSTGLSFEKKENEAILILGHLPNDWNKNLEVKERILGTGEDLNVNVVNYSDDDVELNPFTRLSSIFFLKASGGQPIFVDQLDDTLRGDKGFGSTGAK